jgi:hypothetical protein
MGVLFGKVEVDYFPKIVLRGWMGFFEEGKTRQD